MLGRRQGLNGLQISGKISSKFQPHATFMLVFMPGGRSLGR